MQRARAAAEKAREQAQVGLAQAQVGLAQAAAPPGATRRQDDVGKESDKEAKAAEKKEAKAAVAEEPAQVEHLHQLMDQLSTLGVETLPSDWRDDGGETKWMMCSDPNGAAARTDPTEVSFDDQTCTHKVNAHEFVQVLKEPVATACYSLNQIKEEPAAFMADNAVHAGWAMVAVPKTHMGKKLDGSFDPRWLVVIQQEDNSRFLAAYETEEATEPVRVLQLVTSQTTVLKPKNQRKDYPHCVRVDVNKDNDLLAEKWVIADDTEEELAEWTAAIQFDGTSTQAPTPAVDPAAAGPATYSIMRKVEAHTSFEPPLKAKALERGASIKGALKVDLGRLRMSTAGAEVESQQPLEADMTVTHEGSASVQIKGKGKFLPAMLNLDCGILSFRFDEDAAALRSGSIAGAEVSESSGSSVLGLRQSMFGGLGGKDQSPAVIVNYAADTTVEHSGVVKCQLGGKGEFMEGLMMTIKDGKLQMRLPLVTGVHELLELEQKAKPLDDDEKEAIVKAKAEKEAKVKAEKEVTSKAEKAFKAARKEAGMAVKKNLLTVKKAADDEKAAAVALAKDRKVAMGKATKTALAAKKEADKKFAQQKKKSKKKKEAPSEDLSTAPSEDLSTYLSEAELAELKALGLTWCGLDDDAAWEVEDKEDTAADVSLLREDLAAYVPEDLVAELAASGLVIVHSGYNPDVAGGYLQYGVAHKKVNEAEGEGEGVGLPRGEISKGEEKELKVTRKKFADFYDMITEEEGGQWHLGSYEPVDWRWRKLVENGKDTGRQTIGPVAGQTGDIKGGERHGDVAGCDVRDLQNARKGHPYAFRLDLKSEDSGGLTKFVISVPDQDEMEKWKEVLTSVRGTSDESVAEPEPEPSGAESDGAVAIQTDSGAAFAFQLDLAAKDTSGETKYMIATPEVSQMREWMEKLTAAAGVKTTLKELLESEFPDSFVDRDELEPDVAASAAVVVVQTPPKPSCPTKAPDLGDPSLSLTVTWWSVDANSACEFELQYGGKIGGWKTAEPDDMTITHVASQVTCCLAGLKPKQNLTLRVRATNSAGTSDWSDKSEYLPIAPAPAVEEEGVRILQVGDVISALEVKFYQGDRRIRINETEWVSERDKKGKVMKKNNVDELAEWRVELAKTPGAYRAPTYFQVLQGGFLQFSSCKDIPPSIAGLNQLPQDLLASKCYYQCKSQSSSGEVGADLKVLPKSTLKGVVSAYDGEYVEVDCEVHQKLKTFIMAGQQTSTPPCLKLSGSKGFVLAEGFDVVSGTPKTIQDDVDLQELPCKTVRDLAVQRNISPSDAGTAELPALWHTSKNQWWMNTNGAHEWEACKGSALRLEASERVHSVRTDTPAVYNGQFVAVAGVVSTSSFTREQILALPAVGFANLAVHAGWVTVESTKTVLSKKVAGSFERRWLILLKQADSSYQLIAYESPSASNAIDVLELNATTQTSKPKGKRKGYLFCIRIDVDKDSDDEVKWVMATDTDTELTAWQTAIEDPDSQKDPSHFAEEAAAQEASQPKYEGNQLRAVPPSRIAVNVRDGPRISAAKIGTLDLGEMVVAFEQVDVDGHVRVRIGEDRWVSKVNEYGEELLVHPAKVFHDLTSWLRVLRGEKGGLVEAPTYLMLAAGKFVPTSEFQRVTPSKSGVSVNSAKDLEGLPSGQGWFRCGIQWGPASYLIDPNDYSKLVAGPAVYTGEYLAVDRRIVRTFVLECGVPAGTATYLRLADGSGFVRDYEYDLVSGNPETAHDTVAAAQQWLRSKKMVCEKTEDEILADIESADVESKVGKYRLPWNWDASQTSTWMACMMFPGAQACTWLPKASRTVEELEPAAFLHEYVEVTSVGDEFVQFAEGGYGEAKFFHRVEPTLAGLRVKHRDDLKHTEGCWWECVNPSLWGASLYKQDKATGLCAARLGEYIEVGEVMETLDGQFLKLANGMGLVRGLDFNLAPNQPAHPGVPKRLYYRCQIEISEPDQWYRGDPIEIQAHSAGGCVWPVIEDAMTKGRLVKKRGSFKVKKTKGALVRFLQPTTYGQVPMTKFKRDDLVGPGDVAMLDLNKTLHRDAVARDNYWTAAARGWDTVSRVCAAHEAEILLLSNLDVKSVQTCAGVGDRWHNAKDGTHWDQHDLTDARFRPGGPSYAPAYDQGGGYVKDTSDTYLENVQNRSHVVRSKATQDTFQKHGSTQSAYIPLEKAFVEQELDMRTPLIEDKDGVVSRRKNVTKVYDPLHIACFTGDLESVRVLLRYGADIEARSGPNSIGPLDACRDGIPLDPSKLRDEGKLKRQLDNQSRAARLQVQRFLEQQKNITDSARQAAQFREQHQKTWSQMDDDLACLKQQQTKMIPRNAVIVYQNKTAKYVGVSKPDKKKHVIHVDGVPDSWTVTLNPGQWFARRGWQQPQVDAHDRKWSKDKRDQAAAADENKRLLLREAAKQDAERDKRVLAEQGADALAQFAEQQRRYIIQQQEELIQQQEELNVADEYTERMKSMQDKYERLKAELMTDPRMTDAMFEDIRSKMEDWAEQYPDSHALTTMDLVAAWVYSMGPGPTIHPDAPMAADGSRAWPADTFTLFEPFNVSMRGIEVADKPEEKFELMHYHLRAAVQTIPGAKANEPLFRGQDELYGDFNEGDVETWKTYTSTSTKRAAAEGFAGEDGVIFEIEEIIANTGASFATTPPLSAFPNEEEIVLPAGCSFKVLSKEQEGGRTVVRLKHLGQWVKTDSPEAVQIAQEREARIGRDTAAQAALFRQAHPRQHGSQGAAATPDDVAVTVDDAPAPTTPAPAPAISEGLPPEPAPEADGAVLAEVEKATPVAQPELEAPTDTAQWLEATKLVKCSDALEDYTDVVDLQEADGEEVAEIIAAVAALASKPILRKFKRELATLRGKGETFK